MKNILLLIICIVYLLHACGPDKPGAVQLEYDQVMSIHDEVMPETSTIHKLKKELRSLNNKDSIAVLLIQKLDAADEAMMEWMAGFDFDRTLPEDEQIKYLQSEKDKISAVSRKMYQSIDEAQKYLKRKNEDI